MANTDLPRGCSSSSSPPQSYSMDELLSSICTPQPHTDDSPMDNITLEAFLTKAGAVTQNDVVPAPPPPFPVPVQGSSSSSSALIGGNGKRRALEEPLDKATLQRQRRMIKNRESAARSRERKQAYTTELEFLVHQLETENARLLNEEADKKRQRFNELIECIIPVVEKRKPKRLLRTSSVLSL